MVIYRFKTGSKGDYPWRPTVITIFIKAHSYNILYIINVVTVKITMKLCNFK